MHRIRVLQSFGTPRRTTNPYLVMLRDSLESSDDVECLPFSWRSALTGSYDVFHVHWPDTLLAGRSWVTRSGKRVALAGLLLRLRLRGTPVVRTLHNIREPEAWWLDRRLLRALDSQATVGIRINESTPEPAGMRSTLIPHGHYRDWYGGIPRADRVPGRLGYVGLIKPYKGVDALLDAYRGARAHDPSMSLDISGSPADDAVAESMRAAERELPGLDVTLRYVDETEFVDAVTRATLIVLPYRFMHNSGSALAALSLDRPVLVPDNEANRMLAREVGAGWVLRFQGELDSDDLTTALAAVAMTPPAPPDLSRREWSDVAARHADAYRCAVATTARRKKRAPAGADR